MEPTAVPNSDRHRAHNMRRLSDDNSAATSARHAAHHMRVFRKGSRNWSGNERGSRQTFRSIATGNYLEQHFLARASLHNRRSRRRLPTSDEALVERNGLIWPDLNELSPVADVCRAKCALRRKSHDLRLFMTCKGTVALPLPIALAVDDRFDHYFE